MNSKVKHNLMKEDLTYYTSGNNAEIVELGKYDFIRLKGKGRILGAGFNTKIDGILFFYKILQQTCKKQSINFTIPKLEILKWVEGDDFQEQIAEDEWHWIVLLRNYSFINEDLIEEAKDFCLRKKNFALAEEITLENIYIGKCVQIMHYGKIGSEIYSKKELKKYISMNNLKENGFYHEIHLSYPRKVIPENMKCILRQPIE